jgi:hypothetical protein
LNYDSYVPRFSVLIDGYGNVIDHQIINNAALGRYNARIYIKSHKKLDTVYLLKFSSISECEEQNFTRDQCTVSTNS